jgi:hypothetical protein
VVASASAEADDGNVDFVVGGDQGPGLGSGDGGGGIGEESASGRFGWHGVCSFKMIHPRVYLETIGEAGASEEKLVKSLLRYPLGNKQ